ncbi:hypothetical protein [Fusobacterium polymorphum]|jgi:hypothetical protein|uniref:hypothetical protein n=1 Tax=Fusobacterium nucleatum subsp. polymorphum TaxID=76857 RepID=UPI003009218E
MEILEIYNLIKKNEEETIKEEDEKLEELFGELNNEQLLFLSNLRFKYFRLGSEIIESIKNFRKESKNTT